MPVRLREIQIRYFGEFPSTLRTDAWGRRQRTADQQDGLGVQGEHCGNERVGTVPRIAVEGEEHAINSLAHGNTIGARGRSDNNAAEIVFGLAGARLFRCGKVGLGH